MPESFGSYFKKCRIAKKITLRSFCKQNNFNPVDISRIERGMIPPPKNKIIEYAVALGLQPEQNEWLEFIGRASAEFGDIPRILSDEEIVKKLPIFLKTNKPSDLIEKIRRA
jgi:transcriptional regulator with XRE-family HTH domain